MVVLQIILVIIALAGMVWAFYGIYLLQEDRYQERKKMRLKKDVREGGNDGSKGC